MATTPNLRKLHQFMHDCVASHLQHGDHAGAESIAYAIKHGVAAAKREFPGQVGDINNAREYAEQEAAR